jgi:hypothetical protein
VGETTIGMNTMTAYYTKLILMVQRCFCGTAHAVMFSRWIGRDAHRHHARIPLGTGPPPGVSAASTHRAGPWSLRPGFPPPRPPC